MALVQMKKPYQSICQKNTCKPCTCNLLYYLNYGSLYNYSSVNMPWGPSFYPSPDNKMVYKRKRTQGCRSEILFRDRAINRNTQGRYVRDYSARVKMHDSDKQAG